MRKFDLEGHPIQMGEVPTPVRRFNIKISGMACGFVADSKEDALRRLKSGEIHPFCSFIVDEVGVDVDEAGWAIPKKT